jgi:hypothetical protein
MEPIQAMATCGKLVHSHKANALSYIEGLGSGGAYGGWWVLPLISSNIGCCRLCCILPLMPALIADVGNYRR